MEMAGTTIEGNVRERVITGLRATGRLSALAFSLTALFNNQTHFSSLPIFLYYLLLHGIIQLLIHLTVTLPIFFLFIVHIYFARYVFKHKPYVTDKCIMQYAISNSVDA